MKTDFDYYRTLLVEPDAPPALIHSNFRTLMQRLRSSSSPEAHEQAVSLSEAYSVLSDPERRAAYDLARDVARSQREADYAATAVLTPDKAEYVAHIPARRKRGTKS